MVTKKTIEKWKELVHNPDFQKPIQTKDYSQKGIIILVTKIKPSPDYAKQ